MVITCFLRAELCITIVDLSCLSSDTSEVIILGAFTQVR